MGEINKIEAKSQREREIKVNRVLMKWIPERRQAGRPRKPKRAD